ncbi:HTH-type transcriptional regulator XapR [Lentibacillus sp. JNUCC-1]|uniref:LysR family transcriptional regulator n=1 Tax=Lentibacillus sp. JNUCC-1 TaxID=2654513 RepID=UPI0012E92AE6|nr:LysR family transcriptional regulator [Lentibacillus sp. JNUCC-1]MUV38782.1 HTH-type transcriptional regulator XapR [Lentibacillus sp. JNUCC-1]
MKLKLLKYFFAVTEELHFSRAADQLGISQPTLSQQIRNLEGELNTVLFHRDGGKVEITDTGYILLKHVNRILLEIDQATKSIEDFNKTTRGEIRVGCSGNQLLFEPMLNFHKQFPHVKVSISVLKTEKTIERLLNSSIDLGVVFLPAYHEQLETIPLFSANLHAITSINHEVPSQKKVDLKYLSQYPLFFMPAQYYIRQVIDLYCESKGFKLNPTVESPDVYSLIKMATLNEGFTILPKIYINPSNRDNTLALEIEEELPSLQVGVIFKKGMYTSPVVKAFIKHIENTYVSKSV